MVAGGHLVTFKKNCRTRTLYINNFCHDKIFICRILQVVQTPNCKENKIYKNAASIKLRRHIFHDKVHALFKQKLLTTVNKSG